MRVFVQETLPQPDGGVLLFERDRSTRSNVFISHFPTRDALRRWLAGMPYILRTRIPRERTPA